MKPIKNLAEYTKTFPLTFIQDVSRATPAFKRIICVRTQALKIE